VAVKAAPQQPHGPPLDFDLLSYGLSCQVHD